jgi:hypothetical protein
MLLAGISLYITFKTIIHLISFIKIVSCSIIVYLLAQLYIPSTILLPLFYIFLFAIYIGLLIILKEIKQDDITTLTRIWKKA